MALQKVWDATWTSALRWGIIRGASANGVCDICTTRGWMHSEFRDPVHGPIAVSEAEHGVIREPGFQRLGRIKQLGFGEATFPGASHSRYLHSLGAMHLSGMAFDVIARGLDELHESTRLRLRAVVRLAALLHDVGHPPLSHQLEYLLPPLHDLDLPAPILDKAAHGVRAEHEHMSLLLILRSSLADAIESGFADLGVKASHVAEVLFPALPQADPAFFEHKGRSLLPLLQNLVSGELDCDRMDYLRRDAYFAGVSYGKYDQAWILSNLVPVPGDERFELGLDVRALHAFEDFLLARYHMFLMVYAHRSTLILDKMLRLFMESAEGIKTLPSEPDAYMDCDDGMIHNLLKANTDNPWADRVLRRNAIPCVLEIDEDRDEIKGSDIESILDQHGIEYLTTTVHTPFSSYAFGGKPSSPHLKVVLRDRVMASTVRRMEEVTDLYTRYRRTPKLVRFHVLEKDLAAYGALDLPALHPLP